VPNMTAIASNTHWFEKGLSSMVSVVLPPGGSTKIT